jgi:hypothetical protein
MRPDEVNMLSDFIYPIWAMIRMASDQVAGVLFVAVIVSLAILAIHELLCTKQGSAKPSLRNRHFGRGGQALRLFETLAGICPEWSREELLGDCREKITRLNRETVSNCGFYIQVWGALVLLVSAMFRIRLQDLVRARKKKRVE